VLNECTKLAKSGEYHLLNATKAHTSTIKRGCFNPKAQTVPHSGKVQHGSTNLIAPARDVTVERRHLWQVMQRGVDLIPFCRFLRNAPPY